MDSIVLYALAFLLVVHKLFSCPKKRDLEFLAAFLIAGTALALYEGADLLLMLSGVLIFNGMVTTYHSKKNYAFFLLAVFFIAPIYHSTTLIAQMMLAGFMSGAYFFVGHSKRADISIEKKRDIAQVILGMAFILAFAFLAETYVKLLLIAAILLFSAIGNFSVSNKKNLFSKTLHSFERSGTILGQGAMWLAAGALVAMSFLNNTGLVAVLVAILLGDAVATLVGTSYKKPLPYNKGKSIWGTLSYFVTTAVISFPFVGYIGIAIALVAALIESAPRHIDDNFDTAVALTVLLALLGYASIVL